ncbi:hypothetical protein ARMSODRAFT_978448 [Armillaria solidipes]|uniref:Uncharacterized protein n=1 Tax=Armillaria solidipes TaxID=1076256 RepID=A0A2H3BLB7_9AGAR|nr:hypothetical protein ARMSODRAFT_978448 [Armillaria solidipes]
MSSVIVVLSTEDCYHCRTRWRCQKPQDPNPLLYRSRIVQLLSVPILFLNLALYASAGLPVPFEDNRVSEHESRIFGNWIQEIYHYAESTSAVFCFLKQGLFLLVFHVTLDSVWNHLSALYSTFSYRHDDRRPASTAHAFPSTRHHPRSQCLSPLVEASGIPYTERLAKFAIAVVELLEKKSKNKEDDGREGTITDTVRTQTRQGFLNANKFQGYKKRVDDLKMNFLIHLTGSSMLALIEIHHIFAEMQNMKETASKEESVDSGPRYPRARINRKDGIVSLYILVLSKGMFTSLTSSLDFLVVVKGQLSRFTDKRPY